MYGSGLPPQPRMIDDFRMLSLGRGPHLLMDVWKHASPSIRDASNPLLSRALAPPKAWVGIPEEFEDISFPLFLEHGYYGHDA